MTEDRKFGCIVGGLFTLLGVLLLVWRHRLIAGAVFTTIGIFLLFAALISPQMLAGPHHFWQKIGHALGRFNTFLLLSCIFFLVMTPLGFFFHLMGRDLLRRHKRPETTASMWSAYSGRVADRTHFERMF